MSYLLQIILGLNTGALIGLGVGKLFNKLVNIIVDHTY